MALGDLLGQLEPVLGMLAFQKLRGSHTGDLTKLGGAGACELSEVRDTLCLVPSCTHASAALAALGSSIIDTVCGVSDVAGRFLRAHP